MAPSNNMLTTLSWTAVLSSYIGMMFIMDAPLYIREMLLFGIPIIFGSFAGHRLSSPYLHSAGGAVLGGSALMALLVIGLLMKYVPKWGDAIRRPRDDKKTAAVAYSTAVVAFAISLYFALGAKASMKDMVAPTMNN